MQQPGSNPITTVIDDPMLDKQLGYYPIDYTIPATKCLLHKTLVDSGFSPIIHPATEAMINTDSPAQEQQPETPTPVIDELTIDCKLLKQLMHAVAKDDIRYYLLGLFVDAENKALVATNGQILVKYDMPEMQIQKSFLIPHFELYTELKKGMKVRFQANHTENTLQAHLLISNEIVEFCHIDWLQGAKLYPQWRNNIPQIDEKPALPEATIGFCTHILKHIAKTFPKTERKESAVIKFEFYGEEKSIVLTSKDYPALTMIAMPARLREQPVRLPE